MTDTTHFKGINFTLHCIDFLCILAYATNLESLNLCLNLSDLLSESVFTSSLDLDLILDLSQLVFNV